MADLSQVRDVGVGGGALLAGVRLIWPLITRLVPHGPSGNGNGKAYIEGKDIGAILNSLETIATNTAPIPSMAATNGEIREAIAAVATDLAKHNAGTEPAVRASVEALGRLERLERAVRRRKGGKP